MNLSSVCPSRDVIGRRALVKDWRRNLSLLFQPSMRRRLRREISNCKSSGEYLECIDTNISGGSNQRPTEILRFLEFASKFHPRTTCEIGTASGGTNLLLSHALPSLNCTIGIDLYIQNRRFLRTLSRPGHSVHLLAGSSHDAATQKRLRRILSDEPLDLLFIDGDHTLQGALADFMDYRSLVSDGGIIAFHDIVPDSRIRGRPPTSAYVGEVPHLWRAIKRHYSFYEFIADPLQDGYGIGVIINDRSVSVSSDDLLNMESG